MWPPLPAKTKTNNGLLFAVVKWSANASAVVWICPNNTLYGCTTGLWGWTTSARLPLIGKSYKHHKILKNSPDPYQRTDLINVASHPKITLYMDEICENPQISLLPHLARLTPHTKRISTMIFRAAVFWGHIDRGPFRWAVQRGANFQNEPIKQVQMLFSENEQKSTSFSLCQQTN